MERSAITVDEKKRILREMYERGEISSRALEILMRELERRGSRRPKVLRVYVAPGSKREKRGFWDKLKSLLPLK